MAENPATWGLAEHVVSTAIDRAEAQRALGYCGLSMVRMITDALRDAELLPQCSTCRDRGFLAAPCADCGKRRATS